jgi:hypothetical protein
MYFFVPISITFNASYATHHPTPAGVAYLNVVPLL